MRPLHTGNRKRKWNKACQEEEEEEQQGEDDWDVEQHRAFVSAVFDEGMKYASPSVVMEHMNDKRDLTSDRVKSRLQKFRKRQSKSKTDFMFDYDSCMEKFTAKRGPESRIESCLPDDERCKRSGGGAAIARVTQAILAESSVAEPAKLLVTGGTNSLFGPEKFLNQLKQDNVLLELSLSDKERQSPLGISLGHVMAMVQPLAQIVFRERQRKAVERDRTDNTTANNTPSIDPSTQGKPEAAQTIIRTGRSPSPAKNVWGDSSDHHTFFEVPDDETDASVAFDDKYPFPRPGQLEDQN